MLAVLLLAAALAAPPEAAVHADERSAYETLLMEKARASHAGFAGGPCPTTTVRHLSTQPIKIADHPDFAALIERVSVEGCGHATVENLHVGRTGGSPPWLMVSGLPGDSLADIQLQQSALPQALTQARVELPVDCRGQGMGDIYLAARPGHVALPLPSDPPPKKSDTEFRVKLPANLESQRSRLNISLAWVEVWPLQVCGSDRTTAVVFIPLRDQPASALLFLPVWRQMLVGGPEARPAPAP